MSSERPVQASRVRQPRGTREVPGARASLPTDRAANRYFWLTRDAENEPELREISESLYQRLFCGAHGYALW